MHFGILTAGFSWNGGLDFLRNICNALLSNGIDDIKVSVLFSNDKALAAAADYFSCFNGLNGFQVIYLKGSQLDIQAQIKNTKIDVLLPINGVLSEGFNTPWVGYLYDFQHKYFWQNFTRSDCFMREIEFSNRLSKSKSIIVNSRSVKKDVQKFYPWHLADNVFALPFAPSLLPEWLDDNLNVLSTYKIEKKYFIVSNQFWIHKNHKTALEAFKLIHETNQDVQLVCTGAMDDYRKPDYIKDLLSFVQSSNLQNAIKFLGHIPKRHQIELLKNSIAVIQPTCFEGGPGGGSIYDAVALGVPSIVSDIDVNLEIEADNVTFFNSCDSNDLALKMLNVLNGEAIKPTKLDLINNSQCRQRLLRDKLVEASLYALNGK